MLGAYDWPGNIRQLENAIFRAMVLCEGDTLAAEDFPQIRAQVEDMVMGEHAPEPARTPEPKATHGEIAMAAEPASPARPNRASPGCPWKGREARRRDRNSGFCARLTSAATFGRCPMSNST